MQLLGLAVVISIIRSKTIQVDTLFVGVIVVQNERECD